MPPSPTSPSHNTTSLLLWHLKAWLPMLQRAAGYSHRWTALSASVPAHSNTSRHPVGGRGGRGRRPGEFEVRFGEGAGGSSQARLSLGILIAQVARALRLLRGREKTKPVSCDLSEFIPQSCTWVVSCPLQGSRTLSGSQESPNRTGCPAN